MTNDIDRLVDLIAGRVQAELARKKPAASGTAPCDTCKARGSCSPKAVLGAVNEGAARIGATPGLEGAPCHHVAPLIDHTLLKPEATRDELRPGPGCTERDERQEDERREGKPQCGEGERRTRRQRSLHHDEAHPPDQVGEDENEIGPAAGHVRSCK